MIQGDNYMTDLSEVTLTRSLSEVNNQFITLFQCAREEGNITDDVWKRANTVAIYSLDTGICKLECEEPTELKFRQIPKDMRDQLRQAVYSSDQEAISRVLEQMVQQIQENSKSFHPTFWVQPQPDEKGIHEVAFSYYRKTYSEDANGTPNNPYHFRDVVKHNDLTHFLTNTEDNRPIKEFINDLNQKLGQYTEIQQELILSIQSAPIKVHNFTPVQTFNNLRTFSDVFQALDELKAVVEASDQLKANQVEQVENDVESLLSMKYKIKRELVEKIKEAKNMPGSFLIDYMTFVKKTLSNESEIDLQDQLISYIRWI